ncbi:hypothetical protein LTR22_001307 [Elasticomyces elasticus]|nr:hypothetical protein LTR22_001307 [Elasticomyces elasticus]KAK4932145.1 hypothetical protein LTR49_001442 [Elasticomyces elasticus]
MATPSVRATPAYRGTARQSRQSIVPGTPATNTTQRTTGPRPGIALPEYEPPTFSLTPAAQRQIAELMRSRNLEKLDKHLEDAQSAIGHAAADINDRLTQGRKTYAKRKRPNAEPSSQDGEAATANDDEEAARDLAELERKVTAMTSRMEESMRKMIDSKAGVAHITHSLAQTHDDARMNATQAATQQARPQRRARRNSASGSEDEDEDEVQPFTPTDPSGGTQPQTAPVEVFRKNLEDAKTRYQSTSLSFKQMIHDAQNPGEELPPPDPRTFFPEEGEQPAPGVTSTRRGQDAEEDSDDDIAISRATISTKCPLTLRTFEDPLSSKLCSHTFEASAITELLRNSPTRGSVQCPCGGCRETLTAKDLHRDPVLIRKLKRIQRAKELEEEDAENEGGTDGRTQRNATLIDDDGEEIDTVIERQTQKIMKTEPKGTSTARAAAAASNPNMPMPSTEVMELGESSDEEAEEEEDVTME